MCCACECVCVCCDCVRVRRPVIIIIWSVTNKFMLPRLLLRVALNNSLDSLFYFTLRVHICKRKVNISAWRQLFFWPERVMCNNTTTIIYWERGRDQRQSHFLFFSLKKKTITFNYLTKFGSHWRRFERKKFIMNKKWLNVPPLSNFLDPTRFLKCCIAKFGFTSFFEFRLVNFPLKLLLAFEVRVKKSLRRNPIYSSSRNKAFSKGL